MVSVIFVMSIGIKPNHIFISIVIRTKINCKLTNNQFAPFDTLAMLFINLLYTHSCNIQRDKLLWPIKFLKGSVIFSKREKNHCGMSYN